MLQNVWPKFRRRDLECHTSVINYLICYNCLQITQSFTISLNLTPLLSLQMCLLFIKPMIFAQTYYIDDSSHL